MALVSGASGPKVTQLQQKLSSLGFDTRGVDGKFGSNTLTAVKAFQAANGLKVDGKVGPETAVRLGLKDSFEPSPTAPATTPVSGQRFDARGTGYYPDASALEGGFKDRQGKPLATLQDFLSGKSNYVSVAMDSKTFPYGTKLRIPELEAKYGRAIEFRVVDTGGAFKGKGTSRIDICTENRRASLDPTINGRLTLVRQ